MRPSRNTQQFRHTVDRLTHDEKIRANFRFFLSPLKRARGSVFPFGLKDPTLSGKKGSCIVKLQRFSVVQRIGNRSLPP